MNTTIEQLARTARRIEHERRMARIRGRIVVDQAAERTIARLTAHGGPGAARQIEILRLGIQARKFRGDR